MAACTTCNLCDAPGTFETATDVRQVPCPIRSHRAASFTVWRCRNCGSLHCKDDPPLDEYYREYPGHREQVDLPTRITFANRLRMLQQRGLQRDARILDYGCGAGNFVAFLRERGYMRAHGYDAYVPRFADPTVLGGKYDAIVSYDVLEHADDTHAYFGTLSELLDVGGLAEIGTPNADHISLQRRPFASELHQPYHRHILSERALLQLAREFGFEPEHIYRRLYIDSLVPGLNTRFLWAYLDEFDGLIDPAFEPPRPEVVFRSPKLLFYMFFGYFLPPRSNILVSFRKQYPASPRARARMITRSMRKVQPEAGEHAAAAQSAARHFARLERNKPSSVRSRPSSLFINDKKPTAPAEVMVVPRKNVESGADSNATSSQPNLDTLVMVKFRRHGSQG